MTGGDDPCYVAVHKNNKWVTVGNYSGGSLAVFGVNANGSLKQAANVIQHTGSSKNKNRQEKPHVHATVFSLNTIFLITPDLGTDKLMIYAFNAAAQNPLKPACLLSCQPNPEVDPGI
jgi:6-phosphogluconolactonase